MSRPNLTPIEEALRHILQEVNVSTATETVKLADAAQAVLATDIKAQINVPAFDNSAMDGFAVNSKDIGTAANWLPVSQRISAGTVGIALEPGTAARIFTGAPVPPGADSVILQENTEYTEHQVKVRGVVEPGQNIRLCGHDIRCGDEILRAGHLLEPQDIGLLASLGLTEVEIYRPLKIAILNTGDELVAPGQKLQAGQIYESNSFTLQALVKKLGMQCIKLGIVRDDLQTTMQVLAKAAGEVDCIISSGGVSVGEADYVKAAVQALGELSLWKLAIKPGKPFSFGHVSHCPFFGLPGNPVAVFVTFLLLVRPYLLKQQGVRQSSVPSLQVPAAFEQAEAGSRQEYLRVRLQYNELGMAEMHSFPDQGSSVMTSTSWADGLAVVPIGARVRKGDLLHFLPFKGLL